MINLRARQYEPTLSRFSQKDIVRGQVISPQSLNQYAYCANSPMMHIDPSGQYALDSIGNWWSRAKQTTIGKVVDAVIVKPVTSATKKIASVIRPVINAVTEAVTKTVQAYQAAQQEIASIDPSRPTCEIEKQLIWQRACSIAVGDEDTANEITKRLEKVRGYDKRDWLFLAGDCLIDESISLSDRFAMLDILKEKQNITAEDLIDLGLYTEETRYRPFFFELLKEDVASNFAALLGLSYRVTQHGTTVWELSLEEQRHRSQQQLAMLYYLGLQAGLSSVQAYNAAGSAIRMDGASIAAPGYESVPSDFKPFSLGSSNSSEYVPGQGYSSFRAFKSAQGSAGLGRQWHHIVEQNQIDKSGFAPEQIHNTGNIISLDATTHRVISGYYSSIRPFTNGLTVRDWLTGQSFEFQYQFGINIITKYLK